MMTGGILSTICDHMLEPTRNLIFLPKKKQKLKEFSDFLGESTKDKCWILKKA
jgi:hypothetical protein